MLKSIRNLLLSAGVLLCAMPSSADTLPTLYGTMIYSDSWWNGNEYGVYSIDLNSRYSSPSLVEGGYNFNADGGAAYFDGTYVILKTDYSGQSVTYYEYDTEYWDQTDEDELPGTFMGLDFAWDYNAGVLYGICPTGNGGLELAIVDFPSRKKTSVAPISQNIAALAINSTGKMYVITGNGMLAQVDKSTGAITNIGFTGIVPQYMQSATFDLATDKLYWAASFEDDMEGPMAGIYEVNLTTGRATQVKRFNSCEQFVGLFCYNVPEIWEGPDVPLPPTSVNAEYSQEGNVITASISWTAPSAGVHNGELNPESLTYDVVRMPENVKVADKIATTAYEDTFTIPAGTTYVYYTVIPYNGDLKGDGVETERYHIDGPVGLPYVQKFETADAFAAMATIDGDGDGYTWQYNASAQNAFLPGAPFEYTNDYLLTPEFSLAPGRLYKVEATTAEEWAGNYPYSFAAYVGSGETAAGYTNEIFKKERINDPEPQQFKGYTSVDNEGNYRIAFRCYGYDLQYVQLDDITVAAGPFFNAPAAAENLECIPDAAGGRSAVIKFVTPGVDIEGNPVTNLVSANIYRDGTKIGTISTPATGAALSFTDENPVLNAVNNYVVTIENEYGEGLEAEVSAFVGLDTPLKPTNVELKQEGTKVVLSWTAPEKGVNGGYIDPANLVYTIIDPVSYQTVTTTETRYELPVSNDGEQGWFYFYVTATNNAGTSERAMSTTLVSGTPYDLPVYEGFAEGGRDYFWGTRSIPEENNYAYWTPQYDYYGEDADGNSGYIVFQYGMAGNRVHLFSGKIDISKATNPILEYQYVFKAEEGEHTFDTYIIVNGSDTTLVSSKPYTHYYESWDYLPVKIDLKDFKDSDYIQVLFDGYMGDDFTQIRVDAFSVRDFYDYDLAVSLSGDVTSAKPGESITLTADVKNIGTYPADEFSVGFYDGDRLLATFDGENLATDATEQFTFVTEAVALENVSKFSAKVVYEKDLNLLNNVSNVVVVDIIQPIYPTPENLSVTAENGVVTLTWEAPEYADFAVPTLEGAENLEDLSSNLGDWLTIDGDGANTISSMYIGWDEVQLPGLGAPMAFIAFCPENYDIEYYNFWDEPTGWQPAEGKMMFVAYANESVPNDDWLISPELTGEAQTISFSVSGGWSDSYEVLYSTTGRNTADFQLLGYGYATNARQEVTVDLPDGAKYFAIRYCTQSWGDFLSIDNILYTPLSGVGALELQGYNIYRDYEFVGFSEDNSFEDTVDTNSKHLYHVAALYNLGESAPVACEIDTTTGIADTNIAKEEAGRYNLEGMKVGKGYKGIVIILYNDGTTSKQIVR